jgi:hypothetical protein
LPDREKVRLGSSIRAHYNLKADAYNPSQSQFLLRREVYEREDCFTIGFEIRPPASLPEDARDQGQAAEDGDQDCEDGGLPSETFRLLRRSPDSQRMRGSTQSSVKRNTNAIVRLNISCADTTAVQCSCPLSMLILFRSPQVHKIEDFGDGGIGKACLAPQVSSN